MLYRGDNTSAFDNKFLTIEIENENEFEISKAEIKIGNVKTTIEQPEFPLEISLSEEQTKQLSFVNKIYMAVYDSENRKLTCEGTLEFKTKEAVV